MSNDKLQLFENKAIRTAWDEEKEEWYFSIVDVVAVLTDSPNPNNYWKVLMKDEGNQLVTSCNQLKLKSHKDGKRYLTDVATTNSFCASFSLSPHQKQSRLSCGLQKSDSNILLKKSQNLGIDISPAIA